MTLLRGDCLDVLRGLEPCSVDAVVTDPPAGIGFMGVAWDSYSEPKGGGRSADGWDWQGSKERPRTADAQQRVTAKQGRHFRHAIEPIFAECLRVLKPGGHALVWALPRTSHWTATALEDAGFEIRDVITHLFGSGFPKSLNFHGEHEGWGTALKPASEHWLLCRKPLSESTVAKNVQRWGVGALNVDGCRIGLTDSDDPRLGGGGTWKPVIGGRIYANGKGIPPKERPAGVGGRWPANVVLSHSLWCTDGECDEGCPVRMLDAQTGTLTSGANPTRRGAPKFRTAYGEFIGQEQCEPARGVDAGGASRFFYCAKASRSERSAGLEGMPTATRAHEYGNITGDGSTFVAPDGTIHSRGKSSPSANDHPTVKPIALMRWLCRLVTPPGGLILDPFTGSGTTGIAAGLEGFDFMGVEQDEHYTDIAGRRIGWWTGEQLA